MGLNFTTMKQLKDLKVVGIRYRNTRRGLAYEARTNVRGISIWNDGNGSGTYVDGNEHTYYHNDVHLYNEKYTEQELEQLINEFEGV